MGETQVILAYAAQADLWLVMGVLAATCATALFAAGPGAPAAAKRLEAWKVIGPGGGGAQYIPTISPHDWKKVLVRCDMTGAYISEDGGESWRMFNLRGVVQFFVFDPVDPNVIYAKTLGLWRSTDSGRTWNLVHPAPSNVRRVTYADDHAHERVITRDGSTETVAALAIDPADSKVLYAAIAGRKGTGFFVSKDWGRKWKRAGVLPDGALKIYVDPKSAKGNRTVYVMARTSASTLEDGKWVHHPPARGVERFIDASAGFVRGAERPVMYAVSRARWRGRKLSGGIHVSRNGGRTWTNATADLARQANPAPVDPNIRGVAACITQGGVAYIGFNKLRIGRGRALTFGTAKTTDGGRTWKIVLKERETDKKSAPNMKDAWLSERFGPLWGDAPRYLGVAPGKPEICFTTDDGRTMRTTNGGRTWRGMYSKRARGGAWTTAGLDVLTCYGVHADPFDRKRIFISYTDIGLMMSEDGGVSWKSVTAKGVPRPWTNTTYWMVFDPKARGRAWAVMTGVHDLPRPKMWRRSGVAHYNGGVCASEDGGRTWRRSTRGMPETAPTHIVLDPKSPVERRTLYVAGFGTGVWKSVDGGRSWKLKNKGLPRKEPFAWRLVLDGKGVLYLVVARRSDDGTYGNRYDGALYRSTNGAESWKRMRLPDGVNGPNGLAIDASDPRRMYLAAWGRFNKAGDVDGGVWLSTDAGATWRNILSRDQHIYDVTVDGKDPKVIYATGFESTAWRSTNGGRTWRRMKGFNFKWGHRVTSDAHNRKMVYVSTFGGSIWRGPAAGDPDAKEDIATPVMRVH